MTRRFSAVHLTLAVLISLAVGTFVERQPAATRAQAAPGENKIEASSIEINRGSGPAMDLAEGEELRARISATRDSWIKDTPYGGKLDFFTRGADGTLIRKMELTKEGCLLVGNEGPIAAILGSIETAMDHPSRPGALVMRNVHEPIRGCGVTIAFYGSGEHQASMSSAYLGETRRVKQMEKGDLPHGRHSPPYPGPRSAARLEINARVNDWSSNVAMFEPIADDGKAFVLADKDHPWMDQIQYLPPSGEWLNNRRIGRHAFLVGTTHNTGATAGGIVVAGDVYHEYGGRGPVVKSPNGTPYRIVVDDDGNLSTEKFQN